MAKHKCDDWGNPFEEREDQKDGSVKVYGCVTCSQCGSVVHKKLDRVER